MNRRTFILGGGSLITLSCGATATNAALAGSATLTTDFRILPFTGPPTLTTDPPTESVESIHTWNLDFTGAENVASITAEYDFGTEAGSFDELTSDDVTVEFLQDGVLTPMTLDTKIYGGSTATFELTDSDTTASIRVRVTIGTPENGLINPSDGTYTPTLTFENDNGETETYQGELTTRINDSTAVNVSKPTQDQRFTAVPDGQGNVFELDQVDIGDNDGDDDLVEVNYEVREGGTSGTIVGQKTVSFGATARYQPSTSPAETIQPNDGYSIATGQTYTLTTVGEDADGNYASATVQDTSGNSGSAITIQSPSKDSEFTADVGDNQFEVSSVDVRDNDGDDDLVEVAYEVNEGDVDGTTVGTKTVTFNPTSRYRNNNQTEIVQPDDGYSLNDNQQYTLVVQGRDADDNIASATVQDTTPGGNDPAAVNIGKPTKDQEFTAIPPQGNSGNVFEVKQVQVQDGDGDDDITEVDYEIHEGDASGTIVGEQTVTFAATGQYQQKNVTIQPDSSVTIQSGQLYTLVFTGTDADGNFDQSTVQDTP